MTGTRRAPVAAGRRPPYALAAVAVAALVLLRDPTAWLTAPAALTVVWVAGTSAVALLLGDRGWGRIVDAVLGAVFGVVLMLAVALGLHYLDVDIARGTVMPSLVVCSGALTGLATLVRRAPTRGGAPSKRPLLGPAVAAVVLLGAGGLAVALQDRPTPRFEELVLIEPLVDVPPSQRPVAPGADLRVGFELRTHGYRIAGPVRARVDLGEAGSAWSEAGPVASDDARVRSRRTVTAPTRPGTYRLVVRVAFDGPDGEALEREVTTVVVVR